MNDFSSYSSNERNQDMIQSILTKVFGLMFIGLLVSGLVGMYIVSNETLLYSLVAGPGYLILSVIDIATVLILSFAAPKLSKIANTLLFLFYAVLNGATIASVLAAYGIGVAGNAFILTAVVFGVMALFGRYTKTDLTKFGSYLMFGLIGLLIVSIVGIFVPSVRFNIFIMYFGVVLFIAITGYDVQRIKRMIEQRVLYSNDLYIVESTSDIVVLGALTLYLDFINLFIRIASLLGRRD